MVKSHHAIKFAFSDQEDLEIFEQIISLIQPLGQHAVLYTDIEA